MEAKDANDEAQNYYTKLEGGHKTVAKTAKTLVDAGETVVVRNGNSSEYIEPGEHEVDHRESYTVFIEDGIVSATINDDSRVIVRHD